MTSVVDSDPHSDPVDPYFPGSGSVSKVGLDPEPDPTKPFKNR